MQMINLSKDEYYERLAKTYSERHAVYDRNIQHTKKMIIVYEIKMFSVLGTNYQESAVLRVINALQNEVQSKCK